MAVLDEPTTGLDVLTQDRILTELVRLRDDEGMAMVYVSHDLAVVAKMADRIVVMYAGRVVEQGPADDVIERPRHPYTRALVEAIPDFRIPRALRGIPGVSVGVGRVAGRLRLRAALRARPGPLPARRVPELSAAAARPRGALLRWEEMAIASGAEAVRA